MPYSDDLIMMEPASMPCTPSGSVSRRLIRDIVPRPASAMGKLRHREVGKEVGDMLLDTIRKHINTSTTIKTQVANTPPAPATTFPRSRAFRPGRNIIISGLPNEVQMPDVLCRIACGKVTNAFLTGYGGSTVTAVVAFESAAAAREYVSFCQEPECADMWTMAADVEHPNGEMMTVWMRGLVEYHTAFALNDARLRDLLAELPIAQVAYPTDATRCLILKHCRLNLVQDLLARLGLYQLQTDPKFRSQIEDIWVDDYRGTVPGRPTHGTVHIWLTSIRLAVLARAQAHARPVFYGLDFEADGTDRPLGELVWQAYALGYYARHRKSTSLLEAIDLGPTTFGPIFDAWASWAAPLPSEGRRLLAAEVPRAAAADADDSDSDNDDHNQVCTTNRLVSPDTPSTAPCSSDSDGCSTPSPFSPPSSLGGDPARGSGSHGRAAVVATETGKTYPDYSRDTWDTTIRSRARHGWSVSLGEFVACSEEQWAALGTVFYRPPAGS